jgi:hypothetical protein
MTMPPAEEIPPQIPYDGQARTGPKHAAGKAKVLVTEEPTVVAVVPPAVVVVPTPAIVAVKVISLKNELVQALLGAIIAGLGTFVGVLTQTSATDPNALRSAGIATGFVFLTFFTNSLKSWYAQQTSTAP